MNFSIVFLARFLYFLLFPVASIITFTPFSVRTLAAYINAPYTMSLSSSLYFGLGVASFLRASDDMIYDFIPFSASLLFSSLEIVDFPLPGSPVIQMHHPFIVIPPCTCLRFLCQIFRFEVCFL